MATLIKIGKMWYSDYRIGEKRIRRALSKYKPEADRILLSMLEVRRAERRSEIVQDMSWSYFRHTYLRESLAQKDKSTYFADRRSFELIDKATLLTHIAQLTPDRLNKAKISMIESGSYTKSVITRGVRGMITAMRWAEDRKYVAMQNWRIVQKNNKEPGGRMDYYHQDLYLELLSKLSGDWFTSALVMGRAGLRLGEMLHLEWKDVQFGNNRIVFRSKPHLNWTIKKDKALKKVRMIRMNTPDLKQYLEAIRRPDGFVLGPNVSRREDSYGRQLKAALEATGVPTDTGRLGYPHVLRHTFGSHLAQLGISLKKIAAWMGHESQRMTEIYSHLCPEDNGSDIASIGDRLCPTFGPLSNGDQKKLCSGFVPVESSIQPGTVLLGTLDPRNENNDLSSEIHENT